VRAVLGREALPGMGQPLVLPDLRFVAVREVPVVSKGDLHPSAVEELASEEVRLLSGAKLQDEGDVAYLVFDEPVSNDDVTLMLWIELQRASQGTARLSGVRVTFERVDGDWTVKGDPVVLAV
jgi:hypothetical protein